MVDVVRNEAFEDFRLGLWYDFRNPAPPGAPSGDAGPPRSTAQLYAGALEQIAWAEELGFGSVWLTEHHFTDDGYTPSPLVIAASIGARTRGMRIATSLMLLPQHDPVRLAEDAATLSLLTGGRFALGVGLGYRELEFRAFGRDIRARRALMEEGVEVLRRAWDGATIDVGGEQFDYPPLRVTPTPEHPLPLLIGGMVEASIERVARLGDGFLSTQNAHHELYDDALRGLGRDPADGRIYAGQWTLVAEDPERTWARVGEYARYQMNTYISWGAFGPPDQVPQFETPQDILDAGAFTLWDAPTAVAEITRMRQERPQIRDLHFWAQLPGEPLDSGAERIEYMAGKVIPQVHAGQPQPALT